MKIIYSIADLQPESGGPSRSVSALAGAVAERGAEVGLVALEYGSGRTSPMVPQFPVQTTLAPCRSAFTKKFRRSPEFEAALRRGAEVRGRRSEVGSPWSVIGGSPQVILHDNGLWLPTNHAAARVAREMKIPFIISPRGMLTPWAMRFHGLKKRIAWLLYQHRDLQSAQVLHATSHQEAAEFRALGLTQPIAVIPNGVALPPTEVGRQRSETDEQIRHLTPALSPNEAERESAPTFYLRPPTSGFAPTSHLRTILFLSRIHPKKGLIDLVSAWAAVNRKLEISSASALRSPAQWRVVVAGGDDNGHLAEVKAEIRKLGAGSGEQRARIFEDSFKFIGEVADEKKWDIYRSADLFVLPTKSENFGIVIAEALACGLPVITTRGTPWEDLITHRCGWWVEIGARPLADALNEAVNLTDEERRAMGLRGRKLVEENYTWPAAAEKMVAVYHWMLGTVPRPECLVD